MCPESRSMCLVRGILSTPTPKSKQIDFQFSPTSEAAAHNMALYEQHELDYTNIMRSQYGLRVWYGSEFYHWQLMEPLFANHEFWVHMKPIISCGGSFPIKDIDEESRQADNEWHMDWRNHKYALPQIAKVRSFFP
jgi:hypothetical protein